MDKETHITIAGNNGFFEPGMKLHLGNREVIITKVDGNVISIKRYTIWRSIYLNMRKTWESLKKSIKSLSQRILKRLTQ